MAAKKKQSFFQSIGSFLGNIFNKPQPKKETVTLKSNPPKQTAVQKLPVTPNTFSAAPSATRRGSVAQGGSLGNYIQGQGYGSGANLTGITNKIPGTYQTQGGNVTINSSGQVVPTQVLGTAQRESPSGGQSGGQPNYGGQPPAGTTSAEPVETEADRMLKEAGNYVNTIFDLLSQGNLDLSQPFALDEVLAKNAAVQSISPYYAELYGRFKKALDLNKLLGQGKAQRGLQELQQGGENYQTKLQRLLQLGQQQTGEQFSGQGLYESGQRQRAQGLQNVTAQQDLQSYLQGQQRQTQGVKAQEEDLLNRLLLQKQEKESELARAQRTDVESAVQEAQRVAQSRQGIAALEGQPLTNENLPDYFKRRGTALSQFLPS